MDLSWWQREVFYQIYIRSFQDSNGDGLGDINGIYSRLDYIADLGVGAICISPFFKSSYYDSGYDIVDFKEIDPEMGTLIDFRRLVDELHSRDLKVILDFPICYTSIDHPWFKESSSSKDNDKSDYYIWVDEIPNNWYSATDGIAWTYNEKRQQYYMHSYSKLEPDLNWRNENVVDEFKDIFRFWLDFGVDGLNLNAVNLIAKDLTYRDNPKYPHLRKSDYSTQRHIFDRNRPISHRRIRAIRDVFDEYDNRIVMGEIVVESPGEPELAASYFGSHNDELHLAFDYTFIFTKFKPRTWAEAAKRWYDATADSHWPSWVMSNQFNNRIVSRFNGNKSRARLAAMFLLTQKGTPFMYYGDEIGLENLKLTKKQIVDYYGIENWPFKKSRDIYRSPMVWNTEKNAGFSTVTPYLPFCKKNKTAVTKQQKNEVSIYQYYKKFIKLRKSHEALMKGEITLLDIHDDNIIAYLRTSESEALLIILNFSSRKRNMKLSEIGLPLSTEKIIFTTNALQNYPQLDKNMIILQGYEGAIYSLDL